MNYAFFQAGHTKIRGLRAQMSGWDPAESDWKNVIASVDRIEVRGLVISGVAAELKDFSFVPVYQGGIADYDWSDVRLMRLDAVTIRSLTVKAADLKAFLEDRVPGLRLDSLTLDGTVKASGAWHGKSVSAEAALDLDRAARTLRVRLISVSYMGSPVPVSLFKPVKELTISLAPNPETPFAIDLPGLTLRDGTLTVP
jgi:hypothetical protein